MQTVPVHLMTPLHAQVLRVLQAAPNLVSLLKGAEITLAPLRGLDARRDSAAFADLVPWLSDQAIEWAAIACACLDTSAAPPVWPQLPGCDAALCYLASVFAVPRSVFWMWHRQKLQFWQLHQSVRTHPHRSYAASGWAVKILFQRHILAV